jgi:hypothetical protein
MTVEWHDNEPTFPDFLPPKPKAELTGRRRFVLEEGLLTLQVEKSEFVEGRWENNWYYATPSDVQEPVLG